MKYLKLLIIFACISANSPIFIALPQLMNRPNNGFVPSNGAPCFPGQRCSEKTIEQCLQDHNDQLNINLPDNKKNEKCLCGQLCSGKTIRQCVESGEYKNDDSLPKIGDECICGQSCSERTIGQCSNTYAEDSHLPNGGTCVCGQLCSGQTIKKCLETGQYK